MRYKKELKDAVKTPFGACLGTFIGIGILPYFIFNDIYSDVRRIFISGKMFNSPYKYVNILNKISISSLLITFL